LQIAFFKTDYREARLEGGVEAGCADYYIDFVALAFVVDATVCVERCYASFDYTDIFFLESLECSVEV
jgi:hypothetical protein